MTLLENEQTDALKEMLSSLPPFPGEQPFGSDTKADEPKNVRVAAVSDEVAGEEPMDMNPIFVDNPLDKRAACNKDCGDYG